MCCRLQKQRQQTANGEELTVNRVYRQVNTTRNLCAMRINRRRGKENTLKSVWKWEMFLPHLWQHELPCKLFSLSRLRLIIQMQPT